MRVEPALAPVDALHCAQPPRAEERRDPGCPGPLPHPVETLPVLDLVAVEELLVTEDVAVGVDDALGESGGAGGVVQLCRIVGGGVDADRLGRSLRECAGSEHQHGRRPRTVEARRVVGVGHDELGLGVGEPVPDAVVPVEHRQREQDCPKLPDAEEDCGRLRCRRQDDCNAVAAFDAVGGQRVRGLVRQILELAPVQRPR